MPENTVSYSALVPGWCHCLQSAGFKWKCWKQTQREGGENGSRWYISCVLWSSEKLVCGLPGASALLAVQWSAVISRNRVRGMSFRPVATFLLHIHLSGTSLRPVMHHRGVPAGMSPLLLSANIPQHLGCRPLMGERWKRKPKNKKNKKKECRKGKRLVRWGGNELSFHVHSLSFWCPHQNNLRPTAASPGG